MKAIFVCVFLFSINYLFAGNFYFSALSGSDSRSVSEAQNPSTPWKTLSKLNEIFSSLKPGDSVLLKRGETFYGSIIVRQSGSATLPIFIGAYGSGNKPVISSLMTVTGWVSKGNGIWESAANPHLGSTLNMVILNGVEQEMGRYPNSNATNKGYLNFESHVGKTSITDNQLPSAPNWKGAELVLRSRHWVLNRSLITAHSGNKISYTTTSPYEPYENYGYFIQNSPKTLDKIGEWYYNPATKKITVFFGTKAPASFIMQAAATMNNLVYSVKYSNLVFDNLAVKGSNSSGFYITDGANIHIQNCDVLFSGINGVFAAGHSSLSIENCTIANSNNNGIDFPYGINNALVKNNKIVNTAVLAGMLENGEGSGLAIYTNGDGNIIEGNEIRNTGFIGITFYGSNLTIRNNLIDSFCFVKDDGGGIYTHGGSVKTTNRKLIGNIIKDGVGAGPGTDRFDKRSVTGIYMDANTNNVEIRDNTVTTCFQGIMIQSTTGIIIKGNTVFNNVRQMVMIRDKENDPVRNTVMSKNIFFSKAQNQWTLYILSSTNDIKLFGKFDSNYYARPIDDNITISTNYIGSNGIAVAQNFDLDGWKLAYAQDKHSKKTAKQIKPYKITGLKGSNKFINGDFSTNVKGISATACKITWANAGMLDGGYLQVVPSSRGSSVYLKVGTVTKNKNYVLRFSSRSSATDGISLGTSLKQSGSPYAALTLVQNSTIEKTRRENELIFSPSVTESSAIVMFKVADESKYFLDNIKVYEANATITNPDDSIRFEYNATNKVRSIALTGGYIDTKGNKFSTKIVLQPYTSAVLIKNSNSAQNIAPAITITSAVNEAVVTPLSIVNINAVATDADGSVSKVEFFKGTTLIKTEFKAPYDCALEGLAPGNYVITAKATDDQGMVSTSASINLSVTAINIPPVVKMTSPANNSGFTAPADINLAATATDADGSITKVEFFNGSNLLVTEYKYPYTYPWQDVVPGNYTITAKATDNKGATTTSAGIKVTVKAQQAARRSSASEGLQTMPANDTAVSPSLSEALAVRGSNDVFAQSKKSPDSRALAGAVSFRLFPNPAVDRVQVNFEGIFINQKVNLSILNEAGAAVRKYRVFVTGNKIDVDISFLAAGGYILNLSNDNFSLAKKFVKIK